MQTTASAPMIICSQGVSSRLTPRTFFSAFTRGIMIW